MELVNGTVDDLPPQPPMTSYTMISTVMLRSGFEPGSGLGKSFQGIVEPIKIPAKDDEAETINKSVD